MIELLKKKLIPVIWGNSFYKTFLKPFDRIRIDADRESLLPTALNGLCRFSDTLDPDWREGALELGLALEKENFHRKSWEFAQIIHGLRRLDLLTPESIALDIGAGHEELIYFLANRIRKVYAVDLYADQYAGGESEDDVLVHPEKYAPFAFDKERLEFRRMDARRLEFADESFDFVVSLSAIEHFGRSRDILSALREIHRVLKAGGTAALTTEIRLNRLAGLHQSFTLPRLLKLCRKAGFSEIEPARLNGEEEFLHNPITLPMETRRSPHLVLRFLNTVFTSFSLFLRKAVSSENGRRQALVGKEIRSPLRPFSYLAGFELAGSPAVLTEHTAFSISIEVENRGDVTWFRNSSAPPGAVPVFTESRSPGHVIRLGVALSSEAGPLGAYPLCRFELPADLRPGEKIALDLHFPPIGQSGDFRIHLDMVKELCFWFADQGSPTLEIPLSVASKNTKT